MKIGLFLTFIIISTSVCASESDTSKLLPKFLKERQAVLQSLGKTIPLQMTLPASYSKCLFSSWEQSLRGNNEAHTTFLNQVDLLAQSGLTPEVIVSIVSYGHSFVNQAYATHKKVHVDNLGGSNLTELSVYIEGIFDSKSCRKYFYDSKYKDAIKQLAKRFAK